MKYISKILTLIVMIIIIVGLAGCDNNSKNNTTKSNNESSSQSSNSTKNNQNKVDVESLDFVKSAEKQVAMPQKGETIAIIHVKKYGDIKVKFFKDEAPKAVENFITHAKNGYYNGLTFHRIIDDFMIQGGDPTGTGAGGESIWGKNFEDEFSYDLAPYRGALCMANAGSNTNGSQFFIEQANYDEQTENLLKQNGYPENLLKAYQKYGGSMHLFFRHTVFGQVIEGMDVVDKIAGVETDKSTGKPVDDVIIDSVEISEF